MVRRVSPSQFRSMLRRAEQEQRRAVNNYNSAVRNYNNAAKKFVNDYNRAVREHNSRVQANRRRLRSELAKLNSQPSTVTYTVYTASVRQLSESYARLDERAATGLDPAYNRLLDLSERETANSVAVANRLVGVAPEDEHADELQDEVLLDQLRRVSPDLDSRWQGAIYALSPRNPDAARHFCTSSREILTQILDLSAPDPQVLASLPDADRTPEGRPTRRSKIRYLLHRQGLEEAVMVDFADADMENIVQLFRVFNDGTHGNAGVFDEGQLLTIKKRVEDGITFLTAIALDA